MLRNDVKRMLRELRCGAKLGAAEKLMLLVLRGRSESRSCPPSRGSSVGSGDRLPTAKQMAATFSIGGGRLLGPKPVNTGRSIPKLASERSWPAAELEVGERCAAGWRGRTTAGGWGAERAHLARAAKKGGGVRIHRNGGGRRFEGKWAPGPGHSLGTIGGAAVGGQAGGAGRSCRGGRSFQKTTTTVGVS